ncbi:MAG: hypothetical protein EOO43_22815 [Flavobacterium sp.]|nr:MAG: hypothetical protein EOO43_22815 [Flavobacterium sp.]
MNAAWLAENPHEFATEVWKGVQINKLKDKDGKFMKDYYLKEKATERYPWMKDVYDETSGFVHFSNKHIMSATTVSKSKDNVMETFLSKTDNGVSNKNKLEAIMCMTETCNAIADSIFGWIDTKRIKG